MRTRRELRDLYKQGVNITQLLREERGLDRNSDEIIEIAYDLQSGSYVAAMENEGHAKYNKDYTSEIAKVILSLCKPTSVLEAGVGEATTLSGVVRQLGGDADCFGFDLSWSRVACASRWLQRQGVLGAKLCTGNLFHIPFADDSVDLVYTSHSIEPNGGNEERIIRELFRVARRYLILLEPGYELASDEAKKRMDSHGYCKNLSGVAESCGYDVLEHRLFPFVSNPLNPTAITIIKKTVGEKALPEHLFACPLHKTRLEEIGGVLFSREALVAYPVIGGIPCLRIENGVVASKFADFAAGL
jgi:ubiquinone/menaquinone biosynthesis C-methylase UbiE